MDNMMQFRQQQAHSTARYFVNALDPLHVDRGLGRLSDGIALLYENVAACTLLLILFNHFRGCFLDYLMLLVAPPR